MLTLVNKTLRRLLTVLGLCLALHAPTVRANIIMWWDPNGTTSVGGNGVWDATTPNWSADTNGLQTNLPTVWIATNALGFCAGPASGALQGTFTVTVNSALGFAGFFNGIKAPGPCDITLTGAGSMILASGQQAFETYNIGRTRINVPVTGTGNVALESTGQTFLNATNTYTGGTSLGFAGTPWSGVVGYNNSASFGTGTITMVASSSGTMSNTTANAITIANPWSALATTVTLQPGAAGTTFSGAWALTATPTISVGTAGQTATISGVMSGAGGLTKSGNGTLKLSGANTFTGIASVTAGTLQLGVAGGIPSGTSRNPITVTSPGILDLNGLTGTVDGLNGNGLVTNSSATTATLSVGTANTNSAYTGTIQGPINFTKVGTGLVSLGTAGSTYTGVTTISAGTLKYNAANATPDASPVSVAAAGILDFGGNVAHIAAIGGSGVVSNYNQLVADGSFSTTLFNAYSCFVGPLYGSTGSSVIIKDGSHVMGLHSNVTGFYLRGGTLSLSAMTNCLPANSGLALTNGTTLELEAASQTLTNLGGTGGVLNLGGGTLTLTNANSVFNGTIRDSDLTNSSTALGHGLRGYYYDNPDFSSLLTVRDDATINFTNLTTSPNLPTPPYPNTNLISIRWVGQILTTTAGAYIFTGASDDGMRVWVNGSLVIDNWISGSTTKSGTNTLAANTRYDIVVEYFNGIGGALARLSWTPPGDAASTIIPTDNLFLPGPGSVVLNHSHLLLNAASTQTGSFVLTNGTSLSAETDGALGLGNVVMADTSANTLTLENGVTNGYFSPTADLAVNGSSYILNLNFEGTATIHSFSTDGGATYQPAGTYGGIGSAATSQITRIVGDGVLVVTAGPSSVTLSPVSSIVYGNNATFTATVSGGATPTGTVTFYDGTNPLGLSTLDGTGTATFTAIGLQAINSPHSITAVYNGDSTHVRSTSSAVSQSVTAATISVSSITVSNKVYDGTTNASVTVAGLGLVGNDTNFVHATGTAFFTDKEVANGKTVNVSGLGLAGSLAGNYVLSATTATTTANITPLALTVTGITATNRVFDGTTNVAFSLSNATLNGVIAPDAVTLNLASGVGTIATNTVGANKLVTVRNMTLLGANAGDYTVANSTNANTVTISQATTTGTLTSSANPAVPGATVTFTAIPTPATGGVPSGSITFLSDGVSLGSSTLTSGAAGFSTASLALGTHTITSRYAGDVNFIGVTNTLSQVINVFTTLAITNTGSGRALIWTGASTLQSATIFNSSNLWTDLPSATSPYPITVGPTNLFFRLKN